MGKLKAKAKKKGGAVATAVSAVSSLVGGKKSSGGGSRRRMTPAKLIRKIAILKLRRKLSKLQGY